MYFYHLNSVDIIFEFDFFSNFHLIFIIKSLLQPHLTDCDEVFADEHCLNASDLMKFSAMLLKLMKEIKYTGRRTFQFKKLSLGDAA